MTENQLLDIIEGVLLAAAERVSFNRLLALFSETQEVDTVRLKTALAALETRCEKRCYKLKHVEGGYYLQVNPDVSPWIQKLLQTTPQRYSKALLETLAVIAWQQPVTRAEIEAVRGVSVSSQVVRKLLDSGWVKEAGYKPVPGRPALFKTTPLFLMHFGLNALSELSSMPVSDDVTTTH